MDKNVFPKGTYVVLLSTCTGNPDLWGDLPVNHIYQLRESSHTGNFMVEEDMKGSVTNGWSYRNLHKGVDKLLLRAATEDEIRAYKEGIRKVADVISYQIY